ncbi:MAG: hypothetical protein V4735_00950 [Pseudomonadota bacterium]
MGVAEDFQNFRNNYLIPTDKIGSISYRYKRITKQLNIATGEAPIADDGKNPAAVALGRLGGQKGGKARAESLAAAKRKAIAKKAATTRWKNHQKD